jgi:hypothetical protein
LLNERRRHLLYEEVKEVLSVDSADELMAALPPVGWADVATKADLGVIRSEMDGRFNGMEGRMTAGFAQVDGRFAQVDGRFDEMEGRMTAGFAQVEGRMTAGFARVDGRFAQVDGRFAELDGRLEGLSGQLVGEIAKAKDSMRVWTIATLITLILGMAGVAISILQLQH